MIETLDRGSIKPFLDRRYSYKPRHRTNPGAVETAEKRAPAQSTNIRTGTPGNAIMRFAYRPESDYENSREHVGKRGLPLDADFEPPVKGSTTRRSTALS
jgi:hypothetical protein